MREHLVLIFAYTFPPENVIGGARPLRFAKYLSRLGYTCRVFTAADQTGRDDSNTEYVPDPFVTRPRHSLIWLVERVVRKLFLPGDEGMQWSYHACRAARAHIKAHTGARVTIFSTFPPIGSHFAGWQLARSQGLPWIADCRDPLVDKFMDEYRPSCQKRVYRWLERVVARRADALIANTDAALIKWQEKFPSFSNKFHLIWNGFDSEERIQPLPVPSEGCKILSHVGELYHGRDLNLVLKSISRLITDGRLSPWRVRVRLIGPDHGYSIPSAEFIRCAKTQGWLEQVPYQVPKREALQFAQTSNGLLLLQSQCAVRVPAKTFECLQIGRPILAVIQPDSPVERLLERSGVPYRCVYPGSTPEAIDGTVADFFKLPSTAVAASPWFEEQFNAENQTRALDAIIRSLHNELMRETNPEPRFPNDSRCPTVKEKLKDSGKPERPAIDSIERT